jgi:pimeloyl-ACP methyl ester carboxylesterase
MTDSASTGARLPRGRPVVIRAATHNSMWDRPPELNRQLLELLREE